MNKPQNPYIDEKQQEYWNFGFRVGAQSMVLRDGPTEAIQGNMAALRYQEFIERAAA